MRSPATTALLLALGVSLSVSGVSLAEDRAVAFLSDIDEATSLARDANRPVMIHLAAEWCEPCKTMHQELYPKPEIKALLARFIRVEVDVDSPRGKELWMKRAVQGLPTVLFLSPHGEELKGLRITTVPTVSELKAALEGALAHGSPQPQPASEPAKETPPQPAWIQALWFIGCALLMASIYLTLKKQYARSEARRSSGKI